MTSEASIDRNGLNRQELWRLFKWLGAYKLILALLLPCMGLATDEYDVGLHYSFREQLSLPWPRGEEVTFASRFATWDAGPYLAIARLGYAAGSPLCAYYPLWPALISPVTTLLGEKVALIWSLVLGNLISIGALLAVAAYCSLFANDRTVRLALVLLLAFPGAIFLAFPYTEGLFLLLAAVALTALHLQSLRVFAVVALLLPLTRALGIFILIPTFLCSIKREWRPRTTCLFILPPLIGYCIYFAIMAWFTGDPLQGFRAQEFFLNKPSVDKLWAFGEFFRAIFKVGALFGYDDGLLDRLLFGCFVAFLPLCFRADRIGFAFTLALGVLPALSNQFLSYTRFIMMCFPWFLGVAAFLEAECSRTVRYALIAGLLALQVVCFLRHMQFKWVG